MMTLVFAATAPAAGENVGVAACDCVVNERLTTGLGTWFAAVANACTKVVEPMVVFTGNGFAYFVEDVDGTEPSVV